ASSRMLGTACVRKQKTGRAAMKRKRRPAGRPLTMYRTGISRNSGRGGSPRLLDVALQLQRPARKLAVRRLDEESIEAAIMFHRAQRMRGDAQPVLPAERIADERHLAEIRQEPAPRLAVRVAHIVAGHHGLAGEFAAAGHGLYPCNSGTADCREIARGQPESLRVSQIP